MRAVKTRTCRNNSPVFTQCRFPHCHNSIVKHKHARMLTKTPMLQRTRAKNTKLNTHTHTIDILLEQADAVDFSEMCSSSNSLSLKSSTHWSKLYATNQSRYTLQSKSFYSVQCDITKGSAGEKKKDTKSERRIDCLGIFNCIIITRPLRETGCYMHRWCSVKQME